MFFLIQKASLAGAFFLVLGCATYQHKIFESRELLAQGQTTQALEKLKTLAAEDSGDRLVYLLDYGMALSIAGDYQEANKVLLAADKLAEEVDYTSISRTAGSLALSEEMVQYKGDTFEKVFIHAQLAFNFLQLEQFDSALVEARRLNEKLKKYRNDDKIEDFKKNEFGTYLSALIWEASGSFDDAYIAFHDTYKINPSYPGIGEDLIRMSKLSKRLDAYAQWKKVFPQIQENPDWYDKKKAKIFFIVQQGWGPRKVMDPYNYRYPMLRAVRSDTQFVEIEWSEKKLMTNISYDVEQAAIDTLAEDRGALVAKRLAGYATKEVLADQIRQKDELLGAVASLVMHASDRADLRQWSTLPQTIQIARLYIEPGQYNFTLRGKGYGQSETGELKLFENVELSQRKTQFLIWRTLK